MVFRKDEIKEIIDMSNIKRIDGFDYPMGYETIVDLNLVDFEYWYFIPDIQLENRYKGMNERYPNRKYIPFARRDDSDDIACFEEGKGETVFIVHDFADEGYEQRKTYDNIWLWMKAAIDELIEENQ
jgi:hypothetical protein